MANNESNKLDDVAITPENEQAAPVTEALVLEMTTEEAEMLSHEGEVALREMGEEQLEAPAPFDIGGEHIPDPGDVVVPLDKIPETEQEKLPNAPENQKEGKPDKSSKKQARHSKAATQEVRKAESEDARREWEKPISEVKPKKERTPPITKQTPAAEKKESAQEEATAPEPIAPQEPKAVPRKGKPEQIVFISLSELHAFKNHPFQIRDDEEMRAMVESVKDKGVTQPAIVRPREDGGYEIISGHRRQKASELAGYFEMPCIIRNLTDEEAITQMVEDNTNQRESILPSERAKALKMQLEAIKRQGLRADLSSPSQDGPKLENGQRSNAIVAERNKMTVKQVQRYIKLNDLVPDLMKMVDEKKIAFTPAVELSYIKPKNQRYIAVAVESQQSGPSLSQAQRMRELDQKGMLNDDVIDGIMLEGKKEVDKVIISSQELSQYFGKDKTPREMKDTIIKLLDEWKEKQPELAKTKKKQEQEK